VISDGMAEVLRSLGRTRGDELMRASAEALGADGVAVSLVVGNGHPTEPLWWTPGASARFEELRYTLGEGPGPEAIRTRTHVLEPDLEAVRVLIEQVKGVLAERWGTTVDQAFAAFHDYAREQGMGMAELARQVVDGRRGAATIPPSGTPAREPGSDR
jgi:hypothetical protein